MNPRQKSKIRAYHISWLIDFNAACFYECPLVDVGISIKRLVILLDLGLVEMDNQPIRNQIYKISNLGLEQLEQLKNKIY